TLPTLNRNSIELELVKVNVVTDDFVLSTDKGLHRAGPEVLGTHYRGIIKGKPASLASISFYGDQIMGVTDRVATAGTNEAIRLFLGLLGDNHSFYESGSGSRIFYSNVVCNDPEFNFVNIPEHVGYVRIGGFSGSVQEGINFANSVQQQIREADGAEVDAWIVDLSRNDGGNMYPMITGVSSL
ncbi:MAG: S41 family peptidase, partial [Bacteroidota bacterium]